VTAGRAETLRTSRRSVPTIKDSHVLFSNGSNTFPVPNHAGKDISPGVERQILKLLKMKNYEFRKLG